MIFTPSVTERDGETGVPAAGGGDAGFILASFLCLAMLADRVPGFTHGKLRSYTFIVPAHAFPPSALLSEEQVCGYECGEDN